jgi:hypothetical protein
MDNFIKSRMTKPLEISPNEYHSRLKVNRANIFDADSYLSKSVIWELKQASLYRWRNNPKTFAGSTAATWGTVVDCLVTTPDEIGDVVAISPFDSFRTKEAKEWKADQIEAGKTIMSKEVLVEAETAARRLKKHHIAGDLIEKAQKQVVLLNKVKLPGYDEINLKALVDLAPTSGSYLVDIKTTNTVTPLALSKKTAELGYHAQAGLYLKLWNLCFPDDQRDRFIFIWQCSEPPYEVCVSELPAADIHAGEEWIAFQLERLAKATKTNTWPDPFQNKVAVIGRPEWAGYQDEEEYDGIIAAPAHC